MQNGNWTPISKTAVSLLPKNRAYTELEALFCLQVDYNNKISVTVNGYARLWGWSYRQVVNLFDTLNLCLEYPEDTHKKQNQSGVLIEKKTEKISEKITERSVKDNRKIKFIFTNDLQGETERYRKDRRKIPERSALNDYKTLKTEDFKDLKKDFKEPPYSPPKGDGDEFNQFWKCYPKKVGKDAARKAWMKRKLNSLLDTILMAIQRQRESIQWQRDNGQYIPNPATWLNQGRWEDELGHELQEQPRKISKMEQAINNLEALRNGEMVVKRDNHGVEENYITISAGYSAK